MEGKGLNAMLTLLWLVIQAGSPLLGRAPACGWGQRHAPSVGRELGAIWLEVLQPGQLGAAALVPGEDALV